MIGLNPAVVIWVGGAVHTYMLLFWFIKLVQIFR